MKSLKDKRILIYQQRGWGTSIGHFLAEHLQSEGSKLAALTLKKTTDQYIREQKEVHYEMIVNKDAIMEDPEAYLAGDRYSMEEICNDLGIDSIWPIIQTLRNHVRSYEDKYYFKYVQNLSDEDILLFAQAMYKCVKKLFSEFKPDAVISYNYVALPHIMLNLYAAKRGVPMMAFTDCKVKGVYLLTNSYLSKTGAFYDRVDELNEGKDDSLNRPKARQYIDEFRKEFKIPDYELGRNQKQTFVKRIKYHLKPYADIYRFYRYPQENFLKNIGVTIDYRPPRIIIRDYLAHTRNKRFEENFPYYKFEPGKKYAYFPLHVQPEASIDLASPFYNNQIDLARQFALALPGDYILVVKAHPASAGRRSPSIYEKLERTPNVKLLDYRMSSEDVLKNVDIVLSINGSSMAEAGFLNKPSIQVGDLGTTQKLPNVTRHTDLTTLSSKIKEVLSKPLSGKEYEMRLENYVAAAYDTGFPAHYMSEFKTQEEREGLWLVYKKELMRVLS